MAQAAIVDCWEDGTRAYIGLRALERDGVSVEYIGSVPLEEMAGKTTAQKKALLVAAARSAREAQLAGRATIAGVSGTVTL